MAGKSTSTRKQATDGSVLGIIRAGLDLGVSEAARKVAEYAPKVGSTLKGASATGLSWTGPAAQELGKTLREDPDSLVQIAKEVWSRGGPKEKKMAADAVGHVIGILVPYPALGAARELARMARSNREADLVGEIALGPILERNPALVERTKAFLGENEPFVRRAAISALVTMASRKKKFVGVSIQALLFLADSKDEELRRAGRAAVRKVAAVDPRAAARTVVKWAQADPTRQRIALAKSTIQAAPKAARASVEKIVATGLNLVSTNGKKKGTTRARR